MTIHPPATATAGLCVYVLDDVMPSVENLRRARVHANGWVAWEPERLPGPRNGPRTAAMLTRRLVSLLERRQAAGESPLARAVWQRELERLEADIADLNRRTRLHFPVVGRRSVPRP